MLFDWELLNFCGEHEVRITAYGPLAVGRVLENETLIQVAEECGKNAAQVCLRWLVQIGCVAIPASSSPDHIRANMDIFDWELEPEDYKAIEALDR